MSERRFRTQYPHVSGGFAVIDIERGALVGVCQHERDAALLADALNALLVDRIDLYWYTDRIDPILSDRALVRPLVKYLAGLARG